MLTSLLGSWHCVGMCGGLVVAAVRDTVSAIAYHIGRLISYAALGAVAGLIGKTFYITALPFSKVFANTVIGIAFIILGIVLLKSKSQLHISTPFTKPLEKVVSGLMRRQQQSTKTTRRIIAGLIGLLTPALPCGWLYIFLGSAALSHTMITGALVMTALWVGTLPYLILSPYILNKLMKPLQQRFPYTVGYMIIGIGILSLIFRGE